MGVQKGFKNIKNTKAYKIGNNGELRAKEFLSRYIPEENIIHNVVLLDENKNSHQIDLIALTHEGIFVVECKNFIGQKINCGNDMTYWDYQLIKDGKAQTFTFYNPIYQNITHVQEVKKVLKNNYPVYSLVLFCNFNTLVHPGRELAEYVLPLKEAPKYLSKFKPVMNDEQIIKAKEIIKKAHHPEITLQEHIASIQKFI